MCLSAKFHSSANHGGQQLCKCLIFWLLVPSSLNKANLPTALQAGQLGKKIFKSFCCSNKWLFFPSFLFIWLRFKSHQTLYISVGLAHLILCYPIQYVYEICLATFNVSSTLRDGAMQHYFERWFLCRASLRETIFKYWIVYLGVLPECKSWSCESRVINRARKV